MSNKKTNKKAKEILASTSWFSNDALQNALAKKMTRMSVEDGHVFFFENKTVDAVLIIEEGSLCRTKALDEEKLDSIIEESMDASKSMRSIIPSGDDDKWSSFVDEISGRGRVTGLLHVMNQEHGVAYATVKSHGRAIIWKIEAKDFLEVLSSDATFAMEMLSKIAYKMRVGSKSLRGMIKSAKKTLKRSPSSQIIDDNIDESGNKVVRVLCYDSTEWVQPSFKPAIESFNQEAESNGFTIHMDYTNDRLSEQSATYSAGYDAICLFVNDTADANVFRILSLLGVKMIAMRCAGFDRIDTKSAKAHGFTVARVPAYSPYAVAEHATSLLMAVNRKICIASTRVKMANFTLDQSLIGMDVFGKTIGIMGTGKIGQILCKIMNGFGTKILCYDLFENELVKQLGAVYVTKDEIYEQCDVIFLMMPLLPSTRHSINMEVVERLKKGVLLINTARGGLIDTKAVLAGLQSGQIGGVGLDVFENEQEYFFQDWSGKAIEDPDLTSLLGNNKVVLTAHQAFFTQEAVDKIVGTTLENIKEWKEGSIGQAHSNTCIFDQKAR